MDIITSKKKVVTEIKCNLQISLRNPEEILAWGNVMSMAENEMFRHAIRPSQLKKEFEIVKLLKGVISE